VLRRDLDDGAGNECRRRFIYMFFSFFVGPPLLRVDAPPPFVAAGPAWTRCLAPAGCRRRRPTGWPETRILARRPTVSIRLVPIQGDCVSRNHLARYGSAPMIIAARHVGRGRRERRGRRSGPSSLPCGSFIIIENADDGRRRRRRRSPIRMGTIGVDYAAAVGRWGGRSHDP